MKKLEKQIIEKYISYVLEHNEQPKNIYSFAKNAAISESDFYKHFGSFENLEQEIFASFFTNTHNLLSKNEEYNSFDAQNKLLSFYFTFFEVLTANRSYVIFVLSKHKNSLKNLSVLSNLRSHFFSFIQEIEIELPDFKQEKIEKLQQKSLQQVAWTQLLLTLKFWMDDTSPSFEKTDIFIEKSVTTAFELLNITPLKSLIDLGKFIYKEKALFTK
jgi:hypothetical protein